MVVLAQLMSNADARGEGALVSRPARVGCESARGPDLLVCGGRQAEGPLRKLVMRLLEGGVIALLIERMFDTASTVSAMRQYQESREVREDD